MDDYIGKLFKMSIGLVCMVLFGPVVVQHFAYNDPQLTGSAPVSSFTWLSGLLAIGVPILLQFFGAKLKIPPEIINAILEQVSKTGRIDLGQILKTFSGADKEKILA